MNMYEALYSNAQIYVTMGEVSEKYTCDRILFPRRGVQARFLQQVRNELGANWRDIARLFDLHPRTVRDWAREKYCMPYFVANSLAQKANLKLPANIEIKTWKEHLAKAGVAGGKALIRKHGGRVAKDESYRKKRWQQWWDKEGKNKFHPLINQPRPINQPTKSARLAEFVGILLGDGGIAPMQVIVTLHRIDDRKYALFVRSLVHELFGITAGIHKKRYALADDIVVSRVALVRFLVNDVGLKIGNKTKQQVDIPRWIKRNQDYSTACLRGLVDTDGSIFTHRYTIKNKEYSYKKISFTSASEPLRQSVYKILVGLGLNPRLDNRRDVRINSINNIHKYFELVGSHNPKHLKRYKQ